MLHLYANLVKGAGVTVEFLRACREFVHAECIRNQVRTLPGAEMPRIVRWHALTNGREQPAGSFPVPFLQKLFARQRWTAFAAAEVFPVAPHAFFRVNG